MQRLLSRIYVASVSLIAVLTLIYVYLRPIESMHVSRDGIAHFSPPVIHPETGDAIDLGTLVRHYRGD